MQRILTAKEMGEVDRITSDECGIPGIVLMENAATRVVELLLEKFEPLAAERVLVLCGKGNNGGDGLAVARQLIVRKLVEEIDVVLFAKPDELTGDAAANLRMLQGAGCAPEVITELVEWNARSDDTAEATLIIDAMIGAGLSGALRGLIADVVAGLNRRVSDAAYVAVDIPTGMPSETGEPSGEALPADYTVTFTAPKPAQVFPPNCRRLGELRLGRIGTTDDVLEAYPGDPLYLVEAADCAPFVAPRDPESHKGTYGHALCVGGSRAKPGSILMTATAALRMGAGLVSVATAAGATAAIVGRTPELMTLPTAELDDGSLGPDALDPSWFERRDVIAIGPGIGVRPENEALVRRILAESKLPAVVDADGVTALAGAPVEVWKRDAPLVLTPHPGEMARLIGGSVRDVESDRVGAARAFAEKRGVTLVLKGSRTLTAAPDGRVFVNPTGTPAMATAGAGDVLTGLIAGLLAQFPDEGPELVAVAAVYLHGLAGEIAAERWGEQPMLAMDLLDALPEAVRRCR